MQPLTEMATYSFQALRCEDLGKTWSFPFLSAHFQEVKTRTFVLFEEGIVRLFFVIYRVVKPDYMSLEIKTNAENGVIIWQGQVGVDYFYSRKLSQISRKVTNLSHSKRTLNRLIFHLSHREEITSQLA